MTVRELKEKKGPIGEVFILLETSEYTGLCSRRWPESWAFIETRDLVSIQNLL